jgi:hypothetical protein
VQNEYAKQIKEYRAQEKGKAYGKVFVKGDFNFLWNYKVLIEHD